MKRPYISISGTLDELILMEAILAHYYDDQWENWNNEACDIDDHFGLEKHGAWLISTDVLSYHNHDGGSVFKQFKASQIHEILTYIEEYERS